MNMKTRNNKNNLSKSKTNNENNNLTNYTNKNDNNIYITKNIFIKKKTRNRNDNAFLKKKTFNLSSKKYDINNSTTFLNNSNLPNFKSINMNKNICIKSRNKIPSFLKGRPNTIFNKNKLLIKKIKKRKVEEKIKKVNNSNLIVKKRNYSMIAYDNIINNLNKNLTERENNINIKEDHLNNINSYRNKKRDENYNKARQSKGVTGLQINLSSFEHLTKNEINSERNKNIKNNHNRKMSQNKTNYDTSSIFVKNNLLYKKNKAKIYSISSHSISKSKSRSKNKSKISHFQKIKKRTKSFFINSFKTLLIDDTSKWKKIGIKSNNILDNKKNKKIYKEINSNLIKKKVINYQKNKFKNISMNNIEQPSCGIISRKRNLKTYNISFRANSIEIDKNKINDINNKENQSINKKISNKNIKNSFGNNYENSKICHLKEAIKKNIKKNCPEKTLHDNSAISNGFNNISKI